MVWQQLDVGQRHELSLRIAEVPVDLGSRRPVLGLVPGVQHRLAGVGGVDPGVNPWSCVDRTRWATAASEPRVAVSALFVLHQQGSACWLVLPVKHLRSSRPSYAS